MKGIIYLEKFPITPENSSCSCPVRYILVEGDKGGFFHPKCGKFFHKGKKDQR